MPNNPVQIILNASEYLGESETGGGGRNTDFYAGRDVLFAEHRAALIDQVEDARLYIEARGQSVAYAKIRLERDALAKSHRPTEKLFRPEWAPVVGVSGLGELLVEVSPGSLAQVQRAAAHAESETRMEPDKTGKEKPKPTRIRSEVGAVERFDRYRPEDKRGFTLEQCAQWLDLDAAGSLLVLRLFRPLSELAQDETALGNQEVQRSFRAFTIRLAAIHEALHLEAPTEWWEESGLAVLQLPLAVLDEQDRMNLLQGVLNELDEEPLVRHVFLPPIIQPAAVAVSPQIEPFLTAWHSPNADERYPVVGLVDTGVALIPELENWIEGSTDMVESIFQDQAHGTFIAGLLADRSELNDLGELSERPCKIFDIGIHVTSEHHASIVYPRKFIDLLEQLDVEIAEARKLGIRVFNMSLSATSMISDREYSPFATKIDDIVDRHDAILVLPAGNLEENIREVWNEDPNETLMMLGRYRHAGSDRIMQPGESLRSVTVGALDPVCETSSFLKPSQYTRRGPGIGLGRKPDLAHVGGGIGDFDGLRSFGPSGAFVIGSGTSYAAPLVAKTLATLDELIDGDVQRETILALAVQGAQLPPCTVDRALRTIAGDFVGFGVPWTADRLLSTDDHGITLVFESTVRARQQLDFSFQWPQGLVDNSGRCRGKATMTLVYRPPLKPAFGSEIVRVGVEAFLRQERVDHRTGEIGYHGFFKGSDSSGLERERIEHGLKWHTTKRWERTTQYGVGRSSNWKVVVNSLAREGERIPHDGIPFSLVLTLSDPGGEVEVFNQMRRSLRAANVRLDDIRTSYRLRT